jgi:hypothetical protein
MGKPKVTWQDLLAVGALICGYAAMNAEDTLFLGIYSFLGCAFLVWAIRSHEDLGRSLRWLLYFFVVATTFFLSYRTYDKNLSRELLTKEGSLIPANLPMPLSNCPVPQDALAIYIGSNVAWATSFPHTVFRSNGYDLLSLDRDMAGGIVVTAKIFDDRQNLVAEITKNRFLASNYASHFERPDRSALIVYDHLDVPALKVQFMNDRAIEIPMAQIRAPGGRVLSVRPDLMTIGGGPIIAHSCFGNGGASVVF